MFAFFGHFMPTNICSIHLIVWLFGLPRKKKKGRKKEKRTFNEIIVNALLHCLYRMLKTGITSAPIQECEALVMILPTKFIYYRLFQTETMVSVEGSTGLALRQRQRNRSLHLFKLITISFCGYLICSNEGAKWIEVIPCF